MTYGDGVSNVNILKLVKFHQQAKNSCYCHRNLACSKILGFYQPSIIWLQILKKSRKKDPSGWINAGFFVLEPGVLKHIESDETFFEHKPLRNLAKEKELAIFKHHDFWMCMDTLRDRNNLEKMWQDGSAALENMVMKSFWHGKKRPLDRTYRF